MRRSTSLHTGARDELRPQFVRVRSFRDRQEQIGEDFERAENYLSLVGLVIVVLGGIAVSSVTRVFISQKIKSIAVMKCVGGTSRQILARLPAAIACARRARRHHRHRSGGDRDRRDSRESESDRDVDGLVRPFGIGCGAGRWHRGACVPALRDGAAPRSADRSSRHCC